MKAFIETYSYLFTIGGTILGVFGIVLAIIFYLRSKSKKELKYFYKSFNLIHESLTEVPTVRAKAWDFAYETYRNALDFGWDESWNTHTVVSLAQTIWLKKSFDRMPILADALEESGCAATPLLQRLRDSNSRFTRADIALTKPIGMWR